MLIIVIFQNISSTIRVDKGKLAQDNTFQNIWGYLWNHNKILYFILQFAMFLVAAKTVLCFLAGFFNLFLCFKIFTRPIIHNIFNISLACLLGFHGIIRSLLTYFYLQIMENFQCSEEESEMFDKSFVSARFQELRILVLVAQQAIANNIVFRFFVIVYADKASFQQTFSTPSFFSSSS